MKIEQLTPTQDWVDERSNYIGGSEVAAVLGLSQYSTPLQVWMRKKGILPPQVGNPIMAFGHYFEDVMAAWFEQQTGLKTRKLSKPFVSKKHPFLRANVDRQVLADPANGLESTAVLELKTTTSHRMKAVDYQIPDEWHFQLMHYLALSRYETGMLLVYERDTCEFLEPMMVQKDEDLIIDMESKLVEWWQTYMLDSGEGRRPEPINSEDALILYPDSNPEQVVEVTPAGYALYTELQEVRERKSDLIKQEEHLKTKLKDKLGKAERLVCAGKTLVSWKSQSTTRLDSSAIRREHPEFYKQYSKTNQTRRFLCH